MRCIRAANICVIENLDDARVTGEYADRRGHVIVCGLRSVGLRIVEELNLSGVPAVVVDDHPDPALARQLAGWDVPHLAASSRTAGTLTDAGLAGAIAVICAFEDDLLTLETALLTRELRADVRVVVQLGIVAQGDHITLFATPEELRAAGIGGQVRYPEHARPFRPRRRLRHVTVSLLRAVADRRMATALAALVTVLVASTTILHLACRQPKSGPISVLNAAYFTVETVTTVGYGDFSFRGQPAGLIVAAICLMLLGALFVAVFFAMLTNMIVSRRLEESLGRQRITGLSGHVIVIGLGTVGTRVIQRLVAARREVVAVDKDEGNRRLGPVRALGVPVSIADATLPQTLEAASLPNAAAVAVVTSDDLARGRRGPRALGALGLSR